MGQTYASTVATKLFDYQRPTRQAALLPSKTEHSRSNPDKTPRALRIVIFPVGCPFDLCEFPWCLPQLFSWRAR
jgi:hypothetical protein